MRGNQSGTGRTSLVNAADGSGGGHSCGILVVASRGRKYHADLLADCSEAAARAQLVPEFSVQVLFQDQLMRKNIQIVRL